MKESISKPSVRVPVRNIAEVAGFTIGTVSSVLNNRQVERRIPLATVEKIRGTAAQLGYLPDIGARRLRSGTGARPNIVIAFITSFVSRLIERRESSLDNIDEPPGDSVGCSCTV